MLITGRKQYEMHLTMSAPNRNALARELTTLLNAHSLDEYPLTFQFFSVLETMFAGAHSEEMDTAAETNHCA